MAFALDTAPSRWYRKQLIAQQIHSINISHIETIQKPETVSAFKGLKVQGYKVAFWSWTALGMSIYEK
jgi:hypothetical protein